MAKLILKGWKQFKKAIDPNLVGPILEKHVGRATRANAIAVRRRVRVRIKEGMEPKNAPLTALIKGGDKPLVGTKGADLFNAITWKVLNWKTAQVGATRTQDGSNIARLVHEGRVIRVTDDMRGLFWMLWLASKGRVQPGEMNARAKEIYFATNGAQGIKPISKSTTAIVIPGRPYLRLTIDDTDTHTMVETNWTNAVKATLREQAKKGLKI